MVFRFLVIFSFPVPIVLHSFSLVYGARWFSSRGHFLCFIFCCFREYKGIMIGVKIFRSIAGVQPGSLASCSAFTMGDPDRCGWYPVFAPFGGYFLIECRGCKSKPPTVYDPPMLPFVWQYFDAGGQSPEGQMRFFSQRWRPTPQGYDYTR
jgi:hypothetical protein